MSGERAQIQSKTVAPAVVVALPAAAAPMPVKTSRRAWLRRGGAVLLLLLAIGGVAYWWLRPQAGLPPGLAAGNGRLEADEIDIDTKFAGRIAKLFADEGDQTHAGELLVAMDSQDLTASLKQAQSLIVQAGHTLQAAQSALAQQKSQVLLAAQQISRTQTLVGQGYATRELLDKQRQVLSSAIAGENAAVDVIGESQAALDAETHAADVYQVNITDNLLLSPRDGRIEYRVANVGEVLPAGGKVFTMLDTAYVYMDIYLPTLAAGRVKLGSDARIVLDSYKSHPLPAKVVFVSPQAQFTPKTVETRDERDVLMFRVRIRIDPALLLAHAAAVRSGLPGTGYVQTSTKATWPADLQGPASK